MKVDGRCHCGQIRYEAEVNADQVNICHCTDCQTLTGTVFRTSIRATDGTFKILSGEPTVYVKTAESGAKRAQAFCRNHFHAPDDRKAVRPNNRPFPIRLRASRHGMICRLKFD